jgi:FkbM family methyltransferase
MITLRTNGREAVPGWLKSWFRIARRLRRFFAVEVALQDGGHGLRFACENWIDAFRPMSLWQKEPATMAWIESEMKPGMRFLDIGANIGIYTLAAAARGGEQGRVFAFEPHKANAMTLMRNVALSGLQPRVKVFAVGLAEKSGFGPFHYASLDSASTGSQFGHARTADGGVFAPAACEELAAFSIDDLVESGAIEPFDLVKMDVDGNEPAILAGMRRTLSGPKGPRTLQIEINPGQRAMIDAFLAECGYDFAERADTRNGQRAIEQGAGTESIGYNALYRRRA